MCGTKTVFLHEEITINKELFKKKLIMKKATSKELYPDEYREWKKDNPFADESKSQWGTSYLVPIGWFCYSDIVKSLKDIEKKIDETLDPDKKNKLQEERDEWRRRLNAFGEVENRWEPTVVSQSIVHDTVFCFSQEDPKSEEKEKHIREVKPQPIPITIK